MRDTLHWLVVTFAPANHVQDLYAHPQLSTGQHRYIFRRSAIQSAQMRIDRDFALLTTATWSCRAPTLTDSVGAVFLCPGRTSGTSCHLTFGKCRINQNNLLDHWKLIYFQTAPISTSEDNIKRRATAKTSTSTGRVSLAHSKVCKVFVWSM